MAARITGADLRGARESKGWGLEKLAGKIGVTKSHLSKVERGIDGRQVTDQLIQAYKDALRLPGIPIPQITNCNPDQLDTRHGRSGGGLTPLPTAGAEPAAISRTKDVVLAERAFFGVGPVTVAVPLRTMPGRARPVISSEDSRAAETITRLLRGLGFHVESFGIPTHGFWQPRGDTVAICGPKSSIVTEEAIAADPFLTFDADEQGVWKVRERDGTRAYGSLLDSPTPEQVDSAYVARLPAACDGAFLVVAGVHALGSIGAVDYLSEHLSDLYAIVGTRCFSMVVRSAYDGDKVMRSDIVGPVRIHL